MSDFIGHLLAQARPAGVPGLEPRTPSRFEAQWGEAPATETIAEADSAPAAAAREAAPLPSRAAETILQQPAMAPAPRRPRRAADPVETALPVAAPTELADPFRPVLPPPREAAPERIVTERIFSEAREILPAPVTTPQASEVTPQTIVTVETVVPSDPASAPAEAASADAETVPVEPSLAPAEPLPATEPLAPIVPPPIAIAPLEPQIAPAVIAPQPEPIPAPVVEVRIGRIEIHAPEPQPLPAAAPAPAAASGGSRLDLYLARR